MAEININKNNNQCMCKLSTIRLIEPTLEYGKEIWKMKKEIIKNDTRNTFAGCGTLSKCASPNEWIEDNKKIYNIKTCPGEYVPASMYIAVREQDNKVVGIINIRHHINHPVLKTVGGHIGYTVRPSMRGYGYGKEMLRLAINEVRNLNKQAISNIDKLLITCHDYNIASQCIIKSNGGVYESSIKQDKETIQRYWIAV